MGGNQQNSAMGAKRYCGTPSHEPLGTSASSE
jgi:hypothetical protein